MSAAIPLDIQALAVECAAVNQRAAVDRRTELASIGRWNKDLLPADTKFAAELAEAAKTMRIIADRQKARDAAQSEAAA